MLNGYNLESQIPERNCLLYVHVSPVQNTCGLSSFDAQSLSFIKLFASSQNKTNVHVSRNMGVKQASRGAARDSIEIARERWGSGELRD